MEKVNHEQCIFCKDEDECRCIFCKKDLTDLYYEWCVFCESRICEECCEDRNVTDDTYVQFSDDQFYVDITCMIYCKEKAKCRARLLYYKFLHPENKMGVDYYDTPKEK